MRGDRAIIDMGIDIDIDIDIDAMGGNEDPELLL